MAIDLVALKEDYSKLEEEFGKKGAAAVAGVPLNAVKNAFSEVNRYTEAIDKVLKARVAIHDFYTPEQCDLLLKLERLIAESGSAENAAKKLGTSGSTISDIRNCKYRGDLEKFFGDLKSYTDLGQERKALVYKGTKYVPTSVSQYMYQVIRGVHISGGCEIITGDTGIGKSRTINKYAYDNPDNTIVVSPTCAGSSVVGIMNLIAAQLGLGGSDRIPGLTTAVLNRLHDGMLIIIDEAQLLRFPAIDHLRRLSDIFADKDETLGICYVGNPSFMRHFDEKHIAVTGQVFNRANIRPYVKSADVKIEDIKLLFPELAENNQMAEIKFLYAIAQTNGEGIRRAVGFYRSAYNMDGGNVTIDRLAELAQTANLRLPNIGSIIKRLREEETT